MNTCQGSAEAVQPVASSCALCEESLDAEELENPYRDDDGDAICDECYDRHYMDSCGRCFETVENSELEAKPGEIIAIWKSYDDLEPGYYRVLRWPFFADGMIEGRFYEDALQRAAALDAMGERGAKEAMHISGPLCQECRTQITQQLTAEEA